MSKRNDDTTGGALVPIDAVGVLVDRREGDVLSRYLGTEAESYDLDPQAAYEAMIAEIMGAETVTDVLNLPEPSSWSDHLGAIIEIVGVRFMESAYEQGAPIYAVVGAMNLTSGEKIVVTTGEQRIMAQLMKLDELKAFPVRVKVAQSSKANRHGNYMTRLVSPEKANG